VSGHSGARDVVEDGRPGLYKAFVDEDVEHINALAIIFDVFFCLCHGGEGRLFYTGEEV